MKKFIKNFISIAIDRVVGFFVWFKPNPAMFKVLYSYKRIIKEYYSELFLKFKNLVFSKNYWLGLLYNKNISIFDNIVFFLLFAPLFRFLYSLLKLVLTIIYSFYYIYINIVFDLIIVYVEVYAKKLRVFYESSLIKDINNLRKVMLFTNFKQNFLENFKAKKDINIEGFIYKEEFRHKFMRISINLLLFFIWWMPLFLSFFSYIVRVIIALIWGSIVIIFWFFAKYVMLVVSFISIFFIRLRIKFRIMRYRRYLRRTRKKLLRTKRRYWTRDMRLHILFGKLLMKFFFVKDFILKWKGRKDIIAKYMHYCRLIKKSYLTKSYEFNINIIKIIVQKIDNKIINQLKFFNNIADQFTEKNVKFMNWLKLYIMYFLNLYSFKGVMYFFLNYHAENYVFEKYKYKYKYRFRIKYLKISRKLLLLYWKFLFPPLIFVMELFSGIIWIFSLLIIIVKYCLTIFVSVILLILKALKGILVIIFFGKEK